MVTSPFSPKKPNHSVTEWRILAEEAAQEQDPNKLMEIIDALNCALDKNTEHHEQ